MDLRKIFLDYLRRTSFVLMFLVLCSHAVNPDRPRSGEPPENIFANNWRSRYPQPQEIVFDEFPSTFYHSEPSSSRTNGQRSLISALGGDDGYEAEIDSESLLPYGIQNVRDLMQSRGRPPKTKTVRDTKVTFQSLCPSRRETVFLNIDSDFEYRPNHYDEVYCVDPFLGHRDHHPHNNKVEDGVCGGVGFNCIQLNRTIFLTRKSPDTDCWESETRLIPAGCECMWPKHHFGDIGGHH